MYTYSLTYNFGHSPLLTAITPTNLDILDVFFGLFGFYYKGIVLVYYTKFISGFCCTLV